MANLQGPDWDDVRVFLALWRARSLGRGATRLGVDISTASRRLATLEERLGARLFERTRDGLAPTRAAELIQPAAELMESAQARLVRDASAVETEPEGVVRVSAPASLAQDFVAPVLAKLRTRHPRLRLDLDASNRPVDLARREADLALRTARLEGADLVATKLVTLPWYAAASRALAASLEQLSRWDDAPWIGWSDDMASFHAARWIERHVRREQVWMRTSSFPAQLAAARAGVGVVLAPDRSAARLGLVPVAIAPKLHASAAEWPIDELWLVGPRVLRDVPRVAAVWRFLVEELRDPKQPSGPSAARTRSRARQRSRR
jgi:DNA-binding transcriptional LysR family regulator